MKAFYLSLFSLFFLSFPAFSQAGYEVRGTVSDTSSRVKLGQATVSVLQSQDSVLVRFGFAGDDGTFSLGKLRPGKFILLVTYPQYADYVEQFELGPGHPSHDFGALSLTLKSRLLAEVMIKGDVRAIKIKGDTTEFNAKAYVIQPNSKVEDLLRQLPGIQVDKDGKITAQGQTVSKVLVDGEEFFGDDPTLVTRNIRGDMVDKVQLYDKKSDQATFTGIDDGQRTRTLDIKLKEDKKSGYFGKVDGGGATDDFYQGQAMVNAFQAKRKASAYVNLSNTGRTGLSFQDAAKMGSTGSMEFIEGGIMISGGFDELEGFSGRYDGQGLPTARTAGVHYDTKWNGDKYTLNTNYKIGSMGVDGGRSSETVNTLPTGSLINTGTQSFNNDMFRQKLDFTYTVKLDTTSSLKVSVDGTRSNSQARSFNTTLGTRANGTLLNGSSRSVDNDVDKTLLNASLFYSKKLRKKGRTLSLSLSQASSLEETNGYLNSVNDFYNTSEVKDSTNYIDQRKVTRVKSDVFNSNLTYTEPLSPTFSLVFNYGLGINSGSADRRSYNKTAPDRYNALDALYSSDYGLDQLLNQVGANFSYRKNKANVNFGTRATAVNFRQTDLFTDKVYKRNFVNWYPQVSYTYRYSTQKSLSFRYNGNTTQPTLDQVQPLRVNTDPLNITLGNPALKPSYNNRFSFDFNTYKQLTQQSFYINTSYSLTMSPIVSNVVTDAAGKTTVQSVNITDRNSWGLYLDVSTNRKIKALDISVGPSFSANAISNIGYSNNVLNRRASQTYTFQLNVQKYVAKKYDFYLYGGPTYTRSVSSLPNQLNNNGSGLTGRLTFNIYGPGNLSFQTNANYQYRAATQSFADDFSMMIVNSSITKKFFKSQNLALALSGNDLFNQNTGFSRNAYSTTVSQSSYTTIRRYYLLSLTWDFNKMGGGVKTQAPVK